MPINIPVQKPPQNQQNAMEIDTINTPNKRPWSGRELMEERVRRLEEQVRGHSQNLKSSNIAISKMSEAMDAETNEKKNGHADTIRSQTKHKMPYFQLLIQRKK